MLGKVNCVDDIEVCSWQDIQGYPMLTLYDHKTKLLYSSGRTAD